MVRKLEKLVDNYKPKTYPLSYIGDICLQVTIPWGFHQCQQTVERGEPISDASSFKTLGCSSSGPKAFEGSSL